MPTFVTTASVFVDDVPDDREAARIVRALSEAAQRWTGVQIVLPDEPSWTDATADR